MMSLISNIPVAILKNIGFMAILCLVYQVGKMYLKKPAYLYALAILFQVASAVFFIASVFSNSILASYSLPISLPYSILPLIGGLYLIILSIYIIRLVIQLQKTIQLKENANFEAHTIWTKVLNDFSINIPNNVKIAYSDKINSPITLGFLEPIILLPFSIVNHLSTQEIKLIILHELAHILQHDYLMNLLIEIVHCILFYNPFSYYFKKEINYQRELMADAWVVKVTQEPVSYSKALYQLATLRINKEHLPFSMPAINSSHELMERIKFMNNIYSKKNINNKFSILLSAALLFSIFFNLYSSPKNKAIKSQAIIAKNLSTPKTHMAIHNEKKYTIKKQFKNTPIALLDKEEIITKTPTYSVLVKETAKWIKEHENPVQFVTYETGNDSLEYDIAEKLIVQSIVRNYALKKEILQSKLEKVADEKEAYDYLMNSKEWEQILQYDKWARAFLKKHPGTFTPVDSLRSF